MGPTCSIKLSVHHSNSEAEIDQPLLCQQRQPPADAASSWVNAKQLIDRNSIQVLFAFSWLGPSSLGWSELAPRHRTADRAFDIQACAATGNGLPPRNLGRSRGTEEEAWAQGAPLSGHQSRHTSLIFVFLANYFKGLENQFGALADY